MPIPYLAEQSCFAVVRPGGQAKHGASAVLLCTAQVDGNGEWSCPITEGAVGPDSVISFLPGFRPGNAARCQASLRQQPLPPTVLVSLWRPLVALVVSCQRNRL